MPSIQMNELDFMPFIFKNFYSDHSTVGFRYCKDGINSDFEFFNLYILTNIIYKFSSKSFKVS